MQQDLKKMFEQNGFILIENAISATEVRELRKKLFEKFTNHTKRLESIGYATTETNLYDLQFKPKIQDVCKTVFDGEYYFVNDWQIQYNMFGIGGSKKGWHVDCGSEVNERGQYLFSTDYRFGKIGVYLQDNTFEFGGSIDIIPGSQKIFVNTGITKLNLLISRILISLVIKFGKKKTLKTKAGDAVLFDSRLLHRSTPPSSMDLSGNQALAGRSKLPEESCKYALYWEVGSKESVQAFMDNSEIRAAAEYNALAEKDYKGEVVFNEYLSYAYPDSYPNDYVEKVNSFKGLHIAAVDKERSGFYKERLRTIADSRKN
jgi:hypothetical protein